MKKIQGIEILENFLKIIFFILLTKSQKIFKVPFLDANSLLDALAALNKLRQ